MTESGAIRAKDVIGNAQEDRRTLLTLTRAAVAQVMTQAPTDHRDHQDVMVATKKYETTVTSLEKTLSTQQADLLEVELAGVQVVATIQSLPTRGAEDGVIGRSARGEN